MVEEAEGSSSPFQRRLKVLRAGRFEIYATLQSAGTNTLNLVFHNGEAGSGCGPLTVR